GRGHAGGDQGPRRGTEDPLPHGADARRGVRPARSARRAAGRRADRGVHQRRGPCRARAADAGPRSLRPRGRGSRSGRSVPRPHRGGFRGGGGMSTTTTATTAMTTVARPISRRNIPRILALEARYEFLKLLRMPAYVIPTLA